jgi:hypothetical protein
MLSVVTLNVIIPSVVAPFKSEDHLLVVDFKGAPVQFKSSPQKHRSLMVVTNFANTFTGPVLISTLVINGAP